MSRLQNLLQREVDRKQFLTEAGVATLGLVGLGGLIKLLEPPRRTQGYGAGSYGGAQKTVQAKTQAQKACL